MPRPKPFSYIARIFNGVKTEIVEGDRVYAVMFDDNEHDPDIKSRFVAINCLQSPENKPDSIKYARMIYVHKGHAVKKAKELNAIFFCNLFRVVEMEPKRVI